MGPITLFDKSFLQSLSVDESVWFDNFFYAVVCPMFYVETLADLSKSTRKRSPLQEVGVIADKFPEMSGTPTAYHQGLAIANLMGDQVPMTGQIPLSGGRIVKSGDRKGVVFDQLPEAGAFLRWQKREFLEVECLFARVWRAALKSLDLDAVGDGFRSLGIDGKNCKSLDEAKAIADAFVHGSDKQFERMKLAAAFLNVPEHLHRPLLERWSSVNYPPLARYAPYAAYVLTVEIFFQGSLAANLISSQRLSNRSDILYLYYLPFCMVFISSDLLHRRCAPLFLRKNQDFGWGENLKRDLADLNQHYQQLPSEEKEAGLSTFARYPVPDTNSLLNHLWDRHIPNWREKAAEPYIKPPPNPELNQELTKFVKSPPLSPRDIDFDPTDSNMMSIERRVSKKKGSWWQLPKDLEIQEDGES